MALQPILNRLLIAANTGDGQEPPTYLYNLRILLIQLLQAIEIQAADFDPDHPDGFEVLLDGLRDAIDDRLSKHQWP